MQKRVLDIGNCGPDHAAITQLVASKFDAVVDQADGSDEALTLLAQNTYELALVNRLMDCDGSSGMSVIKMLKEHHPSLPVMMITNFPEHQEAAVKIGAEFGFGKKALTSLTTIDLLGQYLSP